MRCAAGRPANTAGRSAGGAAIAFPSRGGSLSSLRAATAAAGDAAPTGGAAVTGGVTVVLNGSAVGEELGMGSGTSPVFEARIDSARTIATELQKSAAAAKMSFISRIAIFLFGSQPIWLLTVPNKGKPLLEINLRPIPGLLGAPISSNLGLIELIVSYIGSLAASGFRALPASQLIHQPGPQPPSLTAIAELRSPGLDKTI